MSEPLKNKEQIKANINNLYSDYTKISEELEKAKTAGDTAKVDSLREIYRTLKSEEERFNNEFARLEEEEQQPEIERIQSLTKEMREPVVSPMPNYMNMGGRGGVGLPVPNMPPPSVPSAEEQLARKREIAGEIYNAPVGEGGMKDEQLPAGKRFAVGALPTDEGELDYLKQQYPGARIIPTTIAGKNQFIITTPEGETFTTLDMGTAGLAGGIAVEGPIIAGSTAAGLAAAAATKNPFTGTAAATAAEAALGTGIDTLIRKSLGMDANLGENLARRSTEALISGGLGVVGDVAVPALRAFSFRRATPTDFTQEYIDAAQRQGLPDIVPPGVQFGDVGNKAAQELAGDYPKSRLAGNMRKAQEYLLTKFDPFRKMATTAAGDYTSLAANQAQKRKELVTQIAQNTRQNEVLVEGAVDRLLKPRAEANVDELGGILRGAVQDLEQQVKTFTEDQYAKMAAQADEAGFSITAAEMLDELPRIRRELNFSGFTDETAVKKLEEKLRERRDAPFAIEKTQKILESRKKLLESAKTPDQKLKQQNAIQDLENELERLEGINKDLDFKSFNELVKSAANLRTENMVGASTKDIFGTQVSNELSALRRSLLKNYNVPSPDGLPRTLADEFQVAADLVNRRSELQEGTLGAILKEAGGENVMTQRGIVSNVMKDPEIMDRVLRAAQELDATKPGTSAAIREKMQNQYLYDVSARKQGEISLVNYDKGYLDVLFGDKSGNVARGLDTLNEKLSAIKKVTIKDLTREDLTAMSSALSKSERNQIADQIVKRERLKKMEDQLAASEVFQAAETGNFQNLDPDILSGAIFGTNSVRDVEIAMAQLSKSSPEARNLYKADFMRMFLDRYRGGKPTAFSHETLFDVDSFLKDYGTLRNPSELGKKIKTVLGNETATALYDLAKLYQGNTIKNAAESSSGLRVIASPSGATFIAPISKLTLAARNEAGS